MKIIVNDKTKVSKKEMTKGTSDEFELFVGTFDDNEFTWYLISKHKDEDKAYKAFKDFVAKQFKLSDEALKKKWDTGRLDIELRKGSKLLQWVGIYSSDVKELDEKNVKKDSVELITYQDLTDPNKLKVVLEELREAGGIDESTYRFKREDHGKFVPKTLSEFVNLIISAPARFVKYFREAINSIYGRDLNFNKKDTNFLSQIISNAANEMGYDAKLKFDSMTKDANGEKVYDLFEDDDVTELINVLVDKLKHVTIDGDKAIIDIYREGYEATTTLDDFMDYALNDIYFDKGRFVKVSDINIKNLEMDIQVHFSKDED